MPADFALSRDTPRAWSRWLPLFVVLFALLTAPFVASSHAVVAGTDAGVPDDETLRAGAEVFNAVCASCHEPGGVGVPGEFPPLVNNPNVADAEYVEDVIRNGRTGEIVVNGETYDGVMDPQALNDDEIVDVIAYIQSGFAAPSGPAPEIDTGPVAGTDLPVLADWTYLAAIAIALGLGALVLGPRVIAANDRRETTWLDAWMKTAVIVVGLIVSIVIVPAKVLETKTVQDLSGTAQDLIALGLWSGALAVGLLALWYAHRERRI